MADNVAGQYGYGGGWFYGYNWLVWVALIALIIYVICTPFYGCC
ncbi:MAG: hypothetical protein ACOYJ1_07215 [Peptococcales bacterium]|jgi:hypothetical protein